MPKMTGLQLAPCPGELGYNRIVLMTSDKVALEATTNSLSFDDYLVKPFALTE
jgi:DNA-binding response OmpR family regulator